MTEQRNPGTPGRRKALQAIAVAGLTGSYLLKSATAQAAEEADDLERSLPTYRVQFLNSTGEDNVFLNIWGYQFNFSSQVAQKDQEFKPLTSPYFPSGSEFIYAVRVLNTGRIVAYGKLPVIQKPTTVLLEAGVDKFMIELLKAKKGK